MSREGVVNNFYFDKEVFTDYMQEQSFLNNLLWTSGVLQYDPVMEEMVGSKNNVGTIPMFKSIDGEGDALNDDGKTDNKPTELSGNKQTFMAMVRMKAWSEKLYTRYLTGKSPLHNLANNLIVPYWRNQWEKDLLAIIKGVMGVEEMKLHKTDLSEGYTGTGDITDANKISLTTHIDVSQKALGDKRTQFALFICHSQVASNIKKKEILENKIFINPITNENITVQTLGNMIVLETDTGTVDNSEGYPVYHSYMLGRGQILTCPKQVPNPYDTKSDPEKYGGLEAIYTKQGLCLHPNGFSIKADNITEESPTREELADSANWELKVNHKAIAMAEIISLG